MRGMLRRGVPATVPGALDRLPVLKPPVPWDAMRIQPCFPADMGLCLPSGQMLRPVCGLQREG